jgi:hypothetical protein
MAFSDFMVYERFSFAGRPEWVLFDFWSINDGLQNAEQWRGDNVLKRKRKSLPFCQTRFIKFKHRF